MVSRNGSHFYEDSAKPKPGVVWWPLNGFNIDERSSWEKISGLLNGVEVFGLTKTAQAAFDLSQMVRADVYVQQLVDEALADTNAVELAGKALLQEYLLQQINDDPDVRSAFEALKHRGDYGKGLFPKLGAAIEQTMSQLTLTSKATLLLSATRNGYTDKVKRARDPGVFKLLKRTVETNPLVQLAVSLRQGRHWDVLSQKNDALLQQLI